MYGLQTNTILMGQPVNVASPLNRGLVAWWLYLPQGGKSTTWFDLCGKNHGTLTNGPTWGGVKAPGAYGSLTFDGADDYVQVSSFPQLVSNVSALAVFRWTSAVNNDILLAHNSGVNNGWRLQVETNLMRFTLGNVANYTIANTTPVTSQWMALVATWTGNLGTATGYLRNLETGATFTASAATGTLSGSPNAITISSPLFANGFHFNGQVSEVAIWNRILGEAEAWQRIEESLRSYPTTLNRLRLPVFGEAGGAPATSKPFYFRHYIAGRAA